MGHWPACLTFCPQFPYSVILGREGMPTTWWPCLWTEHLFYSIPQFGIHEKREVLQQLWFQLRTCSDSEIFIQLISVERVVEEMVRSVFKVKYILQWKFLISLSEVHKIEYFTYKINSDKRLHCNKFKAIYNEVLNKNFQWPHFPWIVTLYMLKQYDVEIIFCHEFSYKYVQFILRVIGSWRVMCRNKFSSLQEH